MAANPKLLKVTSHLETAKVQLDLEERQRRIATAAYYRAEVHGFAPGHEFEDWLDAEREIDEDSGEELSRIPRRGPGR